jgi:catechol 2,3-dioxygenase-like lactoylglutathione lyase family enzyme
MSLENAKLMAFAATKDAAAAKKFYEDVLGLKLLADEQFAVVFDAGGTMLRVSKVGDFTPHTFTVLGWQVADIRAEIKKLTGLGVVFQQFNLDFIPQDELGIWKAGDKTCVAWFKDPDGNMLSLTQF